MTVEAVPHRPTPLDLTGMAAVFFAHKLCFCRRRTEPKTGFVAVYNEVRCVRFRDDFAEDIIFVKLHFECPSNWDIRTKASLRLGAVLNDSEMARSANRLLY